MESKFERIVLAVALFLGLGLLTAISFILLIAEPTEGCFWDCWYGILLEKATAIFACLLTIDLWYKVFK